MTSKFKFLMMALVAIIVFASCGEGEGDAKGSVNVKMTDAPIDDANVQSAVVTVTEVKIDGEAFSGFSGKTTFDLLALQNGNVKALGLSELEAGSYSQISVVLDLETDASGNSPGCYVQTTDGVKHELQTSANSTQELVISKAFEVKEDETTNIVIDFDVRKAITNEANATNDNKYEFVTNAELNAALRTVVEAEAGTVEGKITDNYNSSDKIIVYLYEEGEFNKNTETQGQGSSNIEFKNAVTSAVVDANGNYRLSFINQGKYEAHYASYKQQSDGSFALEGMLSLDLAGALSFGGVTVDAGASASLNIAVFGLLP